MAIDPSDIFTTELVVDASQGNAELRSHQSELGKTERAIKKVAAAEAEARAASEGTTAAVRTKNNSLADAQKRLESYAARMDPAIRMTAAYTKNMQMLSAVQGAGLSVSQRAVDAITRQGLAVARVRQELDGTAARYRAFGDAIAEAAREQQRMEASALKLRDAINPLAAAQRAYEAELANTLALQKAGMITDAERVARNAQLSASFNSAAEGIHRSATRAAGGVAVTAGQMGMLGQQVQDVVVSLAGGQNPFLVILQQAPQAAYAVGGFAELWGLVKKQAASAAAALMTVRGALIASGIGAAAVAVGYLISALSEASANAKRLTEVEDALRRIGDAAIKTEASILGMTEAQKRAYVAVVALDRQKTLTTASKDADRLGELFEQAALKAAGFGRSFKNELIDIPDLFDFAQGAVLRLEKALGVGVGGEIERIRKQLTAAAGGGDFAAFDSLAGQLEGLIGKTPELAYAFKVLRGAMDIAASQAEELAARQRLVSGTATDADRALLGLIPTAYELAASFAKATAEFDQWIATNGAGEEALARYKATLDGVITADERRAITQGAVRDKVSDYTDALRAGDAAAAAYARQQAEASVRSLAMEAAAEASRKKFVELTAAAGGAGGALIAFNAAQAAVAGNEAYLKVMGEFKSMLDRILTGTGASSKSARDAIENLQDRLVGLNRELTNAGAGVDVQAYESYADKIRELDKATKGLTLSTSLRNQVEATRQRLEVDGEAAAQRALDTYREDMRLRELAADATLAQAQGNEALVISLDRERAMIEAGRQAREDYNSVMARTTGLTLEQYEAQQRTAAGAQYDAVKLAETYRDTQREILEISKDISRDVSETIYDGLTDPDGGAKVVDWFKSLFKRIAVQALSANVILPITTAVVGSAPGLFGVGGSGAVGQTAKGATSGGGSITDFLGLGQMIGGTGSTGWLGEIMNAPLFGTSSVGSGFAVGGGAASSGTGAAMASGGGGAITLGGTILPGLGIAAAGFGISQMIAGMAPGNKLASAGGGALGGAAMGAMIGSVVPGIGTTIGAIVGGVAGLIGGMLNDKPSNMEGVNTIASLSSTSAGVDQGQTGKKYSAENWAAARAASDAVRDAAQTAFGKYADLSAAGVSFGVGSRDGSRSYILQNGQIQQEFRAASDEAGMKSLIGQSIAAIGRQYAEKLPIEMQKALQKIDFSQDIDEALRLLDFASSYRDTVKALTEGYGLEDQARKAARESVEQQIDALSQFKKDAAFLELADAGAAVREFALTLVGLKEKKATVSETEAALSALDESFKVFRENLGTLGITLDEVNAGYVASMAKLRSDFNAALDRSINEGLGAGYLNAIEDLLAAQAQRIKDATALGADMGRVYRLNALEIRSVLKDLTADQLASISAVAGAAESLALQLEITFRSITSAIDEQISASVSAADAARNSAKAYRDAQKSMTDAIRDLRGGDLSTLNPLTKLNEARAAFTSASSAAKGGDLTALSNLPGLANALLEASRGYNASSTAYASDFSMVEKALQAAGVSSGALAGGAEYQADLLDVQTRVLESIRDNLADEAGVNETLLREQITALGAIRGLIAASNELTIGQTNATTTRLIAAEKAMQAVQTQIAGGIKITDAATINSALAMVQQGIVGNETAEAKSLRASVAALQSVTQTGLLAVVAAGPTKDALAAAQTAITSTDVKTSDALGTIINAMKAATSQGLSVVASADPIRAALATASSQITGVDTAESKATRSMIDALTAATNTGLSATARADAVTKALATAQTAIAGTDTANAKALQSLVSALNTATAAGMAAETAATKIVQDRVLAAQSAITGNNSAESKAMGSILTGLSALTKTGLSDVAKADAIKAAVSQAAAYTAGVDTAESRAIKGVIQSLSAITNTGLTATAKADAVTKALASAQTSITGVDTSNSTAIRAALDAVRAITGTGLTATAEATKAVKAALATAQAAITSTDAAGSAALSGLIKSLQKVTADGLISVAEGKEIRAALATVSTQITGVDTAESRATRSVIDALTAATNSGLSATAKADAVTKALATAQTAITGTTSASGQAITSIITALRGVTLAGLDDVEAAGPIRAALAAVQAGLAAVMGTTTQAVNASTGQIVNIGKLTDAQIKAILAGNSLTSAGTDAVKNQTGEIITGNAATDVLAQLTKQNATISQQIKDVIAGGNAQQGSLVAAVVAGNEKVAQLLSRFLQLTQQQQDAAAAQAEAARRAAVTAAAQSAYNTQVAAVGANAASAAQSALGANIGQAQQDYYGRHVAITAQGAGEIIKTEKINTSNGVEQNIPRATALAQMLGALGAQVQSIVGGELPQYTVHVSDHNVGDAGTDKALWLLMNGKRLGYAGVNDYNEMARLYLDGLDKYMVGLTSQYKKLLAGIDWSNISAGMSKLASEVYKLSSPYQAPQFATGAAFYGDGIYDRPTAFNMGVMGEAGPEAVMPLANVGGRLGVRASGGSANDNREIVAELKEQNRILLKLLAEAAKGDEKTRAELSRRLDEANQIAAKTASDAKRARAK